MSRTYKTKSVDAVIQKLEVFILRKTYKREH